MQKDLTEVKIFQKVYGGYFFETPCSTRRSWESSPGGVVSGLSPGVVSEVYLRLPTACLVVAQLLVKHVWRVYGRHE